MLHRLPVALLAALLILTCLAGTASAAAVENLPGCTTNTLAANDDNSTAAIPLGFTAHLGENEFTHAFVNNNGTITFDHALGEYDPYDFREGSQPILAPFFADVDTGGAASGLTKYGTTTYEGRPAFCVLWDDVGYFNEHDDKLNRFQLVLVDRSASGGGVDVVFNYDTIKWETGDATDGVNGFGGTPAAAGYTTGEGDLAHAKMLAGSFDSGTFLDGGSNSLAAGTNTGTPGHWRFHIDTVGSAGSRLTGTVYQPGGTEPESGAAVQACRVGGDCVTRFAGDDGRYSIRGLVDAGAYEVTAFSSGTYTPRMVTVNGVTGATGNNHTANITLGDPLQGPPEGTTVETDDVGPDGVPVVFYRDDIVVRTEACPNGAGSYVFRIDGVVVSEGPLTESPAGVYTAIIPAPYPNSGDGQITTNVTCPGGPPAQTDFGIYIDPSGVVADTNGRPIEDATVVLLRSASPDGPFFPVPDGSVVMSPSNRQNPDTTNAEGRFAWDVVAGYYVVLASKDGCVSAANPNETAAESRVMEIPPPVTDLDLRLDCGEVPDGGGGTTPGGGGTTPTTTTSTVAPPRDLLTIGTAKFDARRRKLSVKVSCAASAKVACNGSLVALIGAKNVGTKAFAKVLPGKSATVTIALSKKARALVKIARKKRKKVRFALAATVSDTAGAGKGVQKTVKVKP